MITAIRRPPLGERLARGEVIAVLRVGAGYLKHLRGPFPDLQAVPSGGVDLDGSRQWLAAGAVAVSVGGPLLGDALSGGELDALRDRCRAFRAVVGETTRRGDLTAMPQREEVDALINSTPSQRAVPANRHG